LSSAVESTLPLHARPRRWRPLLLWALVALLVLLLVATLAALLIARHVQPMVRSRLLQVFHERFHSPVSIDDLQVHYNGAIQVDGLGLRVQTVLNGVPGDPAVPMLRVQEFHFHLGLLAALSQSPRIHHVRIRGVQLDLPSVEATHQQQNDDSRSVDLEYAEVDDAHIRFAAAAPDRAPFLFDLPHLVFRGVSRSRPIRFHAVVDNGPPLGITESDGVIGPWNFDDPRQTPIQGQFQFKDKDISSVRGLRGRLTLDGRYSGTVSSLHAEGTTTDPGFGLDVSSSPVALHTRFAVTMEPAQSTVRIDRLEGSFGKSTFVCNGAAVKDRATERFRLDVQLDAPAARVEDALALGTRTAPPVLRGGLALRGRLQMSAGSETVSRKLSLDSVPFTVTGGTFSNPALQQTFDQLAERAQGNPEDATAARASHVSAQIQGNISLRNATVRLANVRVISPGSRAELHGSYSLDGTQFALDGVVHTDAKLSHMTKGVKRVLLKPFDHLLGHSREGAAGATLPIHIRGAGSAAHVDTRVAGLWVKAPGTD
jgi:hypothetical protein